ncbi:hypothetical protein M885DRAFT_231037 [Pelagophyceae sp. CCMP2097]|nr:hypothetical protein M885DRAFT_231037 [Pelagophyceae sp. CCMP2097]
MKRRRRQGSKALPSPRRAFVPRGPCGRGASQSASASASVGALAASPRRRSAYDAARVVARSTRSFCGDGTARCFFSCSLEKTFRFVRGHFCHCNAYVRATASRTRAASAAEQPRDGAKRSRSGAARADAAYARARPTRMTLSALGVSQCASSFSVHTVSSTSARQTSGAKEYDTPRVARLAAVCIRAGASQALSSNSAVSKLSSGRNDLRSSPS